MDELKNIALNQIRTKNNYRKTFNDVSLKELAKSIKENGVLEPILVKQNGSGFVLISGERRYRASQNIGLTTIPAIVKDVDEKDVLRIQLIENIQRENVPYMEEAFGFLELRDKCDADVSELSKITGKSDAYIHAMLTLTKMSREAINAASKCELTKSVAFHIARLPNPEHQTKMAQDLRRSRRGHLVTERSAREYIQNNFGENNRKSRPYRSPIQKQNGNDFQANWKKYLVNFSSQQFEYFKSVVRGRTDTAVLVEAVDIVMRESKQQVEV